MSRAATPAFPVFLNGSLRHGNRAGTTKGSSPKLVPFYYRWLKNCAIRGFLHQQAFELAAAVQV